MDLMEIGIDLEGEEPGEVSKCMLNMGSEGRKWNRFQMSPDGERLCVYILRSSALKNVNL